MSQLPNVITHVSFLLVFVEGLLSFFSPCVLPLLPVYMGYLSGHLDTADPRSRRKIFLMTLSFILGIFFAILLLNTTLTIFVSFFQEHMSLIIRIGGILIILLGIHQLGFVKFHTLEKTLRIPLKKRSATTYLFAFALGFTFSFAWTPCIGPALSSILLLAGSSQNLVMSNLLMLTYALGLTIPFLILGLFTNQALAFFGRHKGVMKYTIKVGAVILILLGIMMFSGRMNAISNYMSPAAKEPSSEQPKEESGSVDKRNQGLTFALRDQNDELIRFEDYRGKVILLNFWATWCPPCKEEMPHLQKLYEKYQNSEDVAILTVVLPGGQEQDQAGIVSFLQEHSYTLPVLFDDGTLYQYFQIYSYPTTFMIKQDGTPLGYVKGQLSRDMMEQLITQTKDAG